MQTKYKLDLVSVNQLKLVSKKEAVSLWESTGDDPNFSVKLPVDTLAPGWYLLEMEIDDSATKLHPILYVDYGNGYVEANKVVLPLQELSDKRYTVLLRFIQNVHGLRLDPHEIPCEFSIGNCALIKLGKLDAFNELIKGIAFRRGIVDQYGKLELTLKTLVKMALRGKRNVIDQLYLNYIMPDGANNTRYELWLKKYDNEKVNELRDYSSVTEDRKFSIIVPTYNTNEKWLRKCIDSVIRQKYESWELCIADDASPNPSVRQVLEEYVKQDERIRVVYRKQNGHISASSNSAIEIAQGDFLVLLDHDDELHDQALIEVAKALDENPRWKIVFTDEDKVDGNGRRYDPYFKADWNYDLFLSHNCISHLGVYEASLVREIGGFRLGYEGSQDWDLALRCIERLDDDQIGHIARVLYHWRAIPGSTALAPGEKSYANDAAMRAIQSHLDRIDVNAEVKGIPGFHGNYKVEYKLPALEPKVSIIIPTRDKVDVLKTCVNSVINKTEYKNFDIIIVDNGSVEKETLEYFDSIKVNKKIRVLQYPHAFNYSAINNFAVRHTDAEYIVLLNNDTEVITSHWLTEMVSIGIQKGVGAVGCMLYFPNNTIQHAGIILGYSGVGGHAYFTKPRGWPGYMIRGLLMQSFSAVTAACLLVKRSTYEEVGGLDETLRVAYNDVDLCLKIREKGYRNILTPNAQLYHYESATRGAEDTPEKRERFNNEVNIMLEKWGDIILNDPAYNPNLNINPDQEMFELSFPPRTLEFRRF